MTAGKEKNSFDRPELLKLPYLVLVVSLLVSIGATYLFYTGSENKDINRFENDVTRIDSNINSKIRTFVAMLKSGRGFVETVNDVNRDNFRSYISSLDLKRNYPGVQGIGYAKRVLSYEAEALAQKMESEGFTNYRVFPESAKYDYMAVLYLEPLDERNRRAIGFDLSSETARRISLEKACDSGEAVATGKVFLVTETEEDKQSGFLIFVPVYKGGGSVPQNVEERRRHLDGYVFSPFRANNFLADVRNSTSTEDISITIYQNEAIEENVLARTHNYFSDASEIFTRQKIVELPDQKWIVEYKALPDFVEKSSSGWTPLIFISGLIFSLLLFGMTYLESFARSRAEKITDELKLSEREKALLFEKEQRARHSAEEASRAKDEFISVVSHELRTPLNTIAGWTRILQADNLAAAMKNQALEKIEKNLRIQTKLVEQLLDFSQIITSKSELSSKPFEISRIFDEAIETVSEEARTKEIRIERANSANGKKVLGDAERLKKALENVLKNAVKFTPKQGSIAAELSERDELIEIKIRDSGSGIAPEFLPYIFEGFRQADSSSTRHFGGLGLGLAIARHIVELHGGTIAAESTGDEKGSVFIIKIPILKDDAKNNLSPPVNE